jgi:hypothetical protein
MIPAMDCINKVLTNHAADQGFSSSIQAALMIGKQTLDQYYVKPELSDVY